MNHQRIEFEGALGHTLAARLDEPDGGARAFAVFAHCFTCSKDIAAASRIALRLTEHGIGVLRFDFTGLGHSDGEFANTTFTSNIGDLIAAAGWLRENRSPPSVLIGHSLGGAAVLAAAHRIDEIRAIATIGAPADPEHVTHLFDDSMQELQREGVAQVSIGGRPFTVGLGLVDDLRAQDPAVLIGSLKKALIVFHSPLDSIVGVENASQIFGWAKHPKSFISLDTADHLLSKREDAAFVADVLAPWAARYIGEPGQGG